MFSATCVKFYTRVLVGKRQKGVTMIEYALIAALISVVAITLMQGIGPKLLAVWQSISDALTPAA